MGDLNFELNRLAGTSGLDAAGAANAYAGTVGKELVGALNAKAGTSGLELVGVANKLAGTTGLDLLKALQAIATFTPTQVTGLLGWWDASVASSVTAVGGRVTGWADQSTSGFNLTAAGTARPTTASHTMNGLNVFAFDGVANILIKSSIVTSAVNTGTWCIVFKPTATTAYERALSLTTATDQDFNGTAKIAAIIRDSNNLGYNSFYNSDVYGTVSVTNAAHVVITQRNGDAFASWCDGAAGTPKSGAGTANFGIQTVAVGGNGASSDFWTGDIAEVLWYSTVVSSANRLLIEAYLKAKWGTP